MKKKITLLLSALIGLTAVLSCIPVSAADAEVTYEENFEYGDTDITSTVNCGSTKIVEENGNHYLTFTPNKDGYSLSPFGPYVADYDFSVRVRQDTRGGQTNVSKILVHSEWGEGSTYQINLYNYRITATSENIKEKVTLAEKPDFEFNDNVWYTIQIFSRGHNTTVFIDGKKVLTFAADARPEGCFGFVTWQTTLCVDDISITEYVDGTAPAVETIIPSDGEENNDRVITESERPTRKMKDNIIKISKVIAENTSVRTFVSILSFAVATVAFVLLIVLIVFEIKKKNKNKGKNEGGG